MRECPKNMHVNDNGGGDRVQSSSHAQLDRGAIEELLQKYEMEETVLMLSLVAKSNRIH